MQTHNTQLTQSLRHMNQYKNIPYNLPTKLILIVRSYWYQRTLYFLNLFLQNIFNNKQSQAQGIFLVECLVVHEASSVTRKNRQTSPKNDFTRNMIVFDTFTKIA